MRKLLRGVVTLAFLACALVPALTRADRIINYPGENPASTDQNQKDRFVRDSVGTFMMQLLGLTGSGHGAYGGLTVSAQTSLNVEVDVPAGAQGVLLQVGQSDTSIPSSTTPQLGADTTSVLIPYFQQANSGGLSVPAPGSNSIYYLVEAQGQTVDTNSQSRLFVDPNNNRYNANVNTVRADQITYQVKAGTAAASPTPPPADANWVGIATVKVPTGATNCSISCVISAQTGNSLGAQIASACIGCATSATSPLTLSGNVLACASCATGQGGTGGALSATSPLNVTGTAFTCSTCVTGVTAGDGTIVIGGTATAPTVKVTAAPSFSHVTDTSLGTGLVCASAGLHVPCDPSHWPFQETVVLVNSHDGCGSFVGDCAPMSGDCVSVASGGANSVGDCGAVTITGTTNNICLGNMLPGFAVVGTGGSGQTTPIATGWFKEIYASTHIVVHFYNATGSTFTDAAGHALATGLTCLAH